MWHAGEYSIGYTAGGDGFEFFLFTPDWQPSPREVFSLSRVSEAYDGYDDWVQQYSREEEINFVTDILDPLIKNPRPVHISGLSCAESIFLIEEYYKTQGYEDSETKNFSLPLDAPVTVSVSLGHLLWCEKDKTFLSKKENSPPRYAVVPPLRTPRDLRTIQQAARMGIVLGVSVLPQDEAYLEQIFEKQILTPFQTAQLLSSRWKEFGFTGTEHNVSLTFPDFSLEI